MTGKGHVHELPAKIRDFYNTDCEKNNTCALERFSIFVREYEVWFPDDSKPSYGTGMIAEYETRSISDIETFAVVQFIRGCVFDNRKEDSGEITEFGEVLIMNLGELKRFCHRGWKLDSFDLDPVYNSNPENGRFYYLRWNSVRGSHQSSTEKYYGEERPKYPIVYLTDLPSSAFTGEISARNVSLEFKTCVYRANDVPAIVEENNLNFAEPIKCFDWQSSYVYNWDLQKFETKDELVFP